MDRPKCSVCGELMSPGHVHLMVGPMEFHVLQIERDEARAEVARLRAALAEERDWLKLMLADAPDSLSRRYDRICAALADVAAKGVGENGDNCLGVADVAAEQEQDARAE